MKISLPAVILIFAGAIFIYSAKNERDPRNVVFEALGIKRRVADPVFEMTGVGSALGRIAGETASKVPGMITNPAPKPTTGGIGPIVSV